MKTQDNHEGGQVLVLLVLAFVVLLGFAALAIDGSMVYTDRRTQQNAADAAALAGAGKAASYISTEINNCTPGLPTDGNFCAALLNAHHTDIENDAIAAAANNGFTIASGQSQNYVIATCTAQYYEVQASITDQTETALAHFVYKGPLENTVEAVARVLTPKATGNGNSIIALNEENCGGQEKGVFVNGNPQVNVTGGGIFSNSCFNTSGGGNGCNYPTDTNCAYVVASSIAYHEADPNGYPSNNMYVGPNPPTYSPTPIQDPQIPQPLCPPASASQPNPGAGTINPGRYQEIRVTANGASLTLNPGVYCVDNEFWFNGATLNGTGVTIVMLGNRAFHTSSTATVNLSAPVATGNGCGNGVGNGAQYGLLLWAGLSQGQTAGVDLLGAANTSFIGTIYAPLATVTLGGTDDMATLTYGTQIYGLNVKLSGSSTLNISYDASKQYMSPLQVSLDK